jgi:hypothetical protein
MDVRAFRHAVANLKGHVDVGTVLIVVSKVKRETRRQPQLRNWLYFTAGGDVEVLMRHGTPLHVTA